MAADWHTDRFRPARAVEEGSRGLAMGSGGEDRTASSDAVLHTQEALGRLRLLLPSPCPMTLPLVP